MGIGHMGRGNCGPGYSRFNYAFFFIDIIAHTSIAINLQMIVLALKYGSTGVCREHAAGNIQSKRQQM